MTDSAVATTQPGAVVASEDFETLRAAIGPDLSNSQVKLAILYAQKVGADLFARDIYPVVVDGRLVFITSIDFARSRALASGEYRGQGQPIYGPDCTCEREELKLTSRRHPEWAEVPVYREGFLEPIIRRAYFHEYAPTEGYPPNVQLKFTWRKMPHVMVAKVSEMLAIRVAFPRELGGLYVNEEMEQAEDRMVEGQSQRLSAGDIPEDVARPEGLTFQGSVMKAPDGVRQVAVPDWARAMFPPDTKTTAKVELPIKVGGRSKHTAIILGPLAYLVEELAIGIEEQAATDGRLVEIEWQKGKPKKKELHGVTRVAVLRDNAWTVVPKDDTIEGEAQEVAPDPTSSSSPSAEPPATTEASPSEPGSTPSPVSSPVATSSSTPPTTADASPSGELPDADVDPTRGGSVIPGGEPPAAADTTPSSATTDAGDALFGEVLEPAPAAVDISQAMKLSVWQADAGQGIDSQVAVIELEQRQTSNGKPFLHAWLLHFEDPKARLEAVMAHDEAQAQAAYDLGAGQVVRLVGTWTAVPSGTVVMVTALVAA